MRHIPVGYKAMKLWMLLRKKIYKKTYMIILHSSGESGEKLQDYLTTTKHIVTFTILFYIEVYPGLWSYIVL